MTTNNTTRRPIRHYQVTDTQAVCNKKTTTGTTVEKAVTCPKCLAYLAKIGA